MALDVLDEHERSELARKWLKDNAASILGGVALGLVLVFGWHQWQASEARHKATAAMQYQALVEADANKDGTASEAMAKKLREEFPKTPYAVLAALRQADAALGAGKVEDAVAAMQWAHENASDPAMQALTVMRLARLELSTGKAEAALKRLQGQPKSGFTALLDELRGDALLALGRKDEARTAYQDALTRLDVGSPHRNFVEMKLDDLQVAATETTRT